MSRRRVALFAVAAVFVLLFGGRWAAIRFTEASWYADLGLSGLYWTRLVHDALWQLAVGGAATLWYAIQTLAVYRSIGAVHLPRRVGNLEIAEAVPRRALRWIALVLAVALGIVTAATFTDVPALVTLYRSAVPLDLQEPVLGHDASFYVARLPLLETLHLAALLLVIFGAFVSGALYAMTGSISVAERRLRMTPHARSHLVALAALLALVVAWGFQLDAYAIVGGGGSAGGALAAADRAVRIPAATALAALALVVAAGTTVLLRRSRPGVLIAMWVTLAVAAVVGRYVAPYLSDAWRGKPDPAVALGLAQYADRYSRAGLGVLDDVRQERPAVASPLPVDSLDALRRALDGLSPWDAEPGLLDAALAAVQSDSARLRAWVTTLDRYPGPGGAPALVALAVPETDVLGLRRAARAVDWTALHRGPLAWAGDPVAVAAAAPDAGSLRFLGTLNPAGAVSLAPQRLARASGRIRYLAHGAELAVVGPDEPPPSGAPAGLRLGGVLRRLLLAWALQSPPLLDRRTSVSDRLLIWRDVPDRLARLYPFATFDAPRAVLANGSLVWVADGYLASARFPLADHVSWNGDEVNFLCAPYVATVDAVTGATRLYLRPPDLPFAARLAAGTGARALPSDSLGAELRRHVGYPDRLFLAQAVMLARHRGDTGTAARPWAVATLESATLQGSEPAPPHATLALLALGGEPPQLWHLLPFADAAGNALVGIVAGMARPDGRLSLRLLRLAAGTYPTLAAAQSRISLSPATVGAVAEAAGPDGNVRRGGIAAIPVAGSVAYAQFFYASQRRQDVPLMPRGLAVLAAGHLGVGADPESAVRALVSARESPAAEAGLSASLAEARAAFLALDSAAHRGDWVQFGHAYETLRRALGGGGAARRP
jgi:uncharacterized membrane protein (UPF0182 family)